MMKISETLMIRAADEGQMEFLRELAAWPVGARPRDLKPQTTQDENRARQKCKRQGLVTFASGYWKLTHRGRNLIT